MSGTINNELVMAVSTLLEGEDLRGTDAAILLYRLVDSIDGELHNIISVLWAVDQLADESNDRTIDERETEERIMRLVALSKNMAQTLGSNIEQAYLEIQKSEPLRSRSDRRQSREGV